LDAAAAILNAVAVVDWRALAQHGLLGDLDGANVARGDAKLDGEEQLFEDGADAVVARMLLVGLKEMFIMLVNQLKLQGT
jgi:hypothetical protein